MCFPPVDTVVNGEISSKNGRMLRIIVLHEANLCNAHVGVFMYLQLHTDIISTPWFGLGICPYLQQQYRRYASN